jgi:hypothetical protein
MWYAVNLLLKSTRSPVSDVEPLWEESIRLVSASSEEEARAKAELLGQAERMTYEVADGSKLSWEFDRVERVYKSAIRLCI